MHPTLPRPPSLHRLALSLTGYTITGADGATLEPLAGQWPRGPYTLKDETGAVIPTRADAPHWTIERIAVRTWRQRCTQADGLTREAVDEQLRLTIELRAAEAYAAALECRVKAIDAAHGDDLWFLDSALGTYTKAALAFDEARRAYVDYSVQVAA
jgi:hypothetical protein